MVGLPQDCFQQFHLRLGMVAERHSGFTGFSEPILRSFDAYQVDSLWSQVAPENHPIAHYNMSNNNGCFVLSGLKILIE